MQPCGIPETNGFFGHRHLGGIPEIRVKCRIYSRDLSSFAQLLGERGWLYSVKIELGKPGFHFLTCLEFDYRTPGDHYILLRLVWVPADSGFSNLHLKDTKVAKLDVLTFDQTCTNMVEGFLDDFSHVLVVVIAALVDRLDDLPFRQII